MSTENIDISGNLDSDPFISKTANSGMSFQLSSVNARDWFQKRREGVQPWAEFLSVQRLKAPTSLAATGKRIVANVEKFQSNYLFVFLGLVVFCILTSPLLLVAIAACLGACYVISIKNADNKLVVLGREITLLQQYSAVGILAFPLFWLAGAGSAVFWVIGASFFVIMLHASLYHPEDAAEQFDAQLTEVQTV